MDLTAEVRCRSELRLVSYHGLILVTKNFHGRLFVFFLACFGFEQGQLAFAQSLLRTELRVPMPEAGPAGLATVLIYPDTPGKHPLVLMTHQASGFKSDNQKIGAGMMQPQATWFAHRGWAVAIVERRGFGDSGGMMEKTHLGCDKAAYEARAADNVKDLTTAYDAVKDRPEVDGSVVIATGDAAGGYAALALGAHAPPALKAVIDFSGGRNSLFLASCLKEGLAPEFRALGATTQVPTLWLFARNDELFSPKKVAQMHEAFTSAGGHAELPAIGNATDGGRSLFSGGVDIWGPLVEDFLQRNELPWQNLDPEAGQNLEKLPDGYPEEIQQAFATWQKLGPNKAFAVGPNHRWGYSSGRKTLKIAKDDALGSCMNPGCKVIAFVGN